MEDLEHLWKLRDGYRRRIALLTEIKAERGELSTGQTIELQQAQRDLEIVEAQIQNGPPSPRLAANSGPDVRIAVVEFQVKAFGQKLDDALASLNGQLAQIRDSAKEWREAERNARERGQAQRAEELRQLWAVIGILMAAVVVLAVAIAIHQWG